MTLRERLVALADCMTAQPALRKVYEQVALDAARMALKDAACACVLEARNYEQDRVGYVAEFCAERIDAMRDGLG